MIYGKELLVIFLSYVLGCISTGYYLTLLIAGKDIRVCGSSSTGARNVGRVLGKKGFVLVFFIDVVKGMFVAWLGTVTQICHWAVLACLVAVLLGHIRPIQLNFHGGKGLAIAIGFLLVFDYWIIIWAGVIFCLCMFVLKKYELSAFIAIAISPLITILTGHSPMDILGVTIAAVVILQAHRRNVIRFLQEISAKKVGL
ncbi:MAG: glycerol-3-phosphate acyltransferase [Sedimentisphaerales bacterium]|nr:glycerol-3-phosphate acyltransferase [Sedimentisphaerales bacterium]